MGGRSCADVSRLLLEPRGLPRHRPFRERPFPAPRWAPSLPMKFFSTGNWLVRMFARESRFVVGMYRRYLKVIGHFGKLHRIFAVPVTTRSRIPLTEIAKLLESRST